jgi:hypothetical protein
MADWMAELLAAIQPELEACFVDSMERLYRLPEQS